MPALNPRQLKFVERYLATGNATQSYIDAGYTKNRDSAERRASLLLRNVEISAAIDAARTKAVQKAELTAESVLAEMRRLAFLDPRRAFNPDGTAKGVHELDADTAACLAGFEVEEAWQVDETTESLEPQARGGALKRTRGKPSLVVRTKKFKFWDKRAALVELGKHFDLWGEGSSAGAAGELLAGFLREAIQRRVAERAAACRGALPGLQQSGGAGGSGPAARVADAPAPETD